MKGLTLFLVVLVVSVGPAWAQLGSLPSGFSEYGSEELELSFFYPKNWYVSEADGTITLANRQGLLEAAEMEMPELQPGDTAMVIGIMPTFFMSMMGIPTDDIATIIDGMFENVLSSNESNLENSSKEVLEFEGRQVATVTFDDTSQTASGIFFVAHEQEDIITFSVAYGFRDSLDRHREVLAQVVSSTEFTGDLESMMQ